MPRKGGEFEREVSKRLSLWWSNGKRDDLLWRSSQSGGRATTRAKRGKTTANQSGDIIATDPSAFPLCRVFAIECKRGYASETMSDVCDRANGAKQQPWESWCQQAIEAHQNEGTVSWMLITRRDQHPGLVFIERKIETKLRELGSFQHKPFMRVSLSTTLRFDHSEKIIIKGKKKERKWQTFTDIHITGYLLEEFLDLISPAHVKAIDKQTRR